METQGGKTIMLKLYTQTVCSKCMLVKFTLENAGVFDKVEIINLDEHEDVRAWLKSNPASASLTGLPILQYGEELFTNQQQEIIDTVVKS